MFSLFNNSSQSDRLQNLITNFTKTNFGSIITTVYPNIDLDEIDINDGIFLNNTINSNFMDNIIGSLYQKLNKHYTGTQNNVYNIVNQDNFQIIQIPFFENNKNSDNFYGFRKYYNIIILNPYFVLFNTNFKNWTDNQNTLEQFFSTDFFPTGTSRLPIDITNKPSDYQLLLSFYEQSGAEQLIYKEIQFPYKTVNGVKKYYYCFYHLIDEINIGSVINYNIEIFKSNVSYPLDNTITPPASTSPSKFSIQNLNISGGVTPAYSYYSKIQSFINTPIPPFTFNYQNCFNFTNTVQGYTSRGFLPIPNTPSGQDGKTCQFLPYSEDSTNAIAQLDTLIKTGNVDFNNIVNTTIPLHYYDPTTGSHVIGVNSNYSITHTPTKQEAKNLGIYTNQDGQNNAIDLRTIQFGVNPGINDTNTNLYATTTGNGTTYTSFSDITVGVNGANTAANTYFGNTTAFGGTPPCLDSSNCIKLNSGQPISNDYSELYKYIDTSFDGKGEQFLDSSGKITNPNYLISVPGTGIKVPNIDWKDSTKPGTYQYIDQDSSGNRSNITGNYFNTASQWVQRTGITTNPFIYDSSFITVLDTTPNTNPFGKNYCSQRGTTDTNNTGVKIPLTASTYFTNGIVQSADDLKQQLWECGNCFNTFDQFGPCNNSQTTQNYWYFNKTELDNSSKYDTSGNGYPDFKLMRTSIKLPDYCTGSNDPNPCEPSWKYIGTDEIGYDFTYAGILDKIPQYTGTDTSGNSYRCNYWQDTDESIEGKPYNIMTQIYDNNISGENVYSCLFNDTNIDTTLESSMDNIILDYNGRCTDPNNNNCSMLANINILPVSLNRNSWERNKTKYTTAENATQLSGGFQFTFTPPVTFSKSSSSSGLVLNHPTSGYLNISANIGPLDPTYICGPAGTGQQGTWNGSQLPEEWCFNIGYPYIQNYTTDITNKIVTQSPFYLQVNDNGIFFNIINDPSVTWGYDKNNNGNSPGIQPFLYNIKGNSYDHQKTECLYDIYKTIGTTPNYGINESLVIQSGMSYNIYGISTYSNTTGTGITNFPSPCNNNVKYNTTGKPNTTTGTLDNPHEIRINFWGAINQPNAQNDTIEITSNGLANGFITYHKSS